MVGANIRKKVIGRRTRVLLNVDEGLFFLMKIGLRDPYGMSTKSH